MNNLKHIWAGLEVALKGGNPADHMDVSRKAFPKSFYALGLAGVLLLISGLLQAGKSSAASLPIGLVITTLFLLTAPTVIYLICHLISKPEIFRPWIVVRNWMTVFVCAAAFIFTALNWFFPGAPQPFGVALTLVYLSTLLLDIRLAQTIADMDWTPAIFIGCAIAVAGMLVVLAVFASAAGY